MWDTERAFIVPQVYAAGSNLLKCNACNSPQCLPVPCQELLWGWIPCSMATSTQKRSKVCVNLYLLHMRSIKRRDWFPHTLIEQRSDEGEISCKKGGIYKDLFKNTHLQWPWILLEVWEKLVFSCSSYKTFALSGIISCFCSWGLPFPEADGADELADILSISEIAESRTHLTLFFFFVASRCGKRGRQQSEYCIKTVKYKTYSIQRAKLESELYFVYQKSLYFLHLKKHKHILKTQLPGTEKVRLTHN